jgi:hypothetical protein
MATLNLYGDVQPTFGGMVEEFLHRVKITFVTVGIFSIVG